MEGESPTPQPLIQSQKQKQEEKKPTSFWYKCGCWTLSVLIWILILLFFITFLLGKKRSFEFLMGCLPIYLFYFILEICGSQTNEYLCNKKKEVKLSDLLESLFQAKPITYIYCDCYHCESDGDGGTNDITTYSEKIPINYYSCRDVSGLFQLNLNEKNISKKDYIKLEIRTEINYADTVSYKEIEIIKQDLKIRNEKKDKFISVKDFKEISGMNRYYLLRLQDKEPKCFNFCWFLLFIFLTFAEIYKIYFNSRCIYQNFTIRKLISTRYDLSSEEFNKKYEKLNPQVNLINQQISYDRNTFIHVLIENRRPMPTEDEILESKIYEPNIPKYEIESGETINNISIPINANQNIPLYPLNKDQNINDNNKLLP